MANPEMRSCEYIYWVPKKDAGSIYVIQNGSRYKIGKTTNWERRKRDALTWLPDLKVIGVKPFWSVSMYEQDIQIGLTDFWIGGEWYDFKGDEFEEMFVEDFIAFDDFNRDRNTANFIYWMNGSGMAEFTMEHSNSGVSKKRWLQSGGWPDYPPENRPRKV